MTKSARQPKATGRPSSGRTRGNSWAWGALLVALVVVVYLPTLDNGFIWDDGQHVLHNPTLRSLGGLSDIWFKWGAIPQYYPLVHTTFWLEYRMWETEPRGYHVVNVMLHAMAVVLLWRLLARLEVPGAWLAAAIFAVHPVHVESVAWISERKNVLSLVLALGSLLAYLRFMPPKPVADSADSGERAWRYYALALSLYFAALLSKTVTASVPAVLLVVYWWKQGRVTARHVVLLAPFFGLGLAMAGVTVWQERTHVGAQGAEWDLTPVERGLIAGRAAWFYAGKLLWPHPLMFYYPRWTPTAGVWWQYLFPAAALGLLVTLWLARNRVGRGPLAAALIFGGVLVPALGFFNIYPFRYSFVADHFQYHASIALVAVVIAVVTTASARAAREMPWVAALAAGGLLLSLVVVAHNRVLVFRDLKTLYEDTLAANPDCWAAHANLGDHLLAQQQYEEALGHYLEARRTVPPFEIWQSEVSIGNVLQDMRRMDEAKEHYERALEAIAPEFRWVVHLHLGSCLQEMNRHEEAMSHYREAVRQNPEALGATAHLNVAACLQQLGDFHEAIGHYREALRLGAEPQWILLLNLGECLYETGQHDSAIDAYRQALALNPNHPALRNRLDEALAGTDQPNESATDSIHKAKATTESGDEE